MSSTIASPATPAVHLFGVHQSDPLPVAVHVYGPALRWNFENPDRPIPTVAVHDPVEGYRLMRLVDEVKFHTGNHVPYLGFHPDRPLPAGKGGQVVAYIEVEWITCVSFSNWNWTEQPARDLYNPGRTIKGPPIIEITPDLSKDRLIAKVMKTYLPPQK